MELWAEDVRQLKSQYPNRVVIASIVGDTKDEWQYLARQMASAGADIIECSLSCPQGSAIEGEENTLGSMVSQGPPPDRKGDLLDQGCRARHSRHSEADQRCHRPGRYGRGCRTGRRRRALPDRFCRSSGRRRPGYLGAKALGSRIHHLWRLQRQGDKTHRPCGVSPRPPGPPTCPSPAVGGIYNWRDAAEFLLLGATTVQVCSAIMEKGFGIIDGMVEGLGSWLQGKGFESVDQIIGLSLPRIVEHESLPHGIQIRAQVDQETCLGLPAVFHRLP